MISENMLNYISFILIVHMNFAQVPKDKDELSALQARLRKRFPVDEYNKAQKELDPNGILSNNMLGKLFPSSDVIWEASLFG